MNIKVLLEYYLSECIKDTLWEPYRNAGSTMLIEVFGVYCLSYKHRNSTTLKFILDGDNGHTVHAFVDTDVEYKFKFNIVDPSGLSKIKDLFDGHVFDF